MLVISDQDNHTVIRKMIGNPTPFILVLTIALFVLGTIDLPKRSSLQFLTWSPTLKIDSSITRVTTTPVCLLMSKSATQAYLPVLELLLSTFDNPTTTAPWHHIVSNQPSTYVYFQTHPLITCSGVCRVEQQGWGSYAIILIISSPWTSSGPALEQL